MFRSKVWLAAFAFLVGLLSCGTESPGYPPPSWDPSGCWELTAKGGGHILFSDSPDTVQLLTAMDTLAASLGHRSGRLMRNIHPSKEAADSPRLASFWSQEWNVDHTQPTLFLARTDGLFPFSVVLHYKDPNQLLGVRRLPHLSETEETMISATRVVCPPDTLEG